MIIMYSLPETILVCLGANERVFSEIETEACAPLYVRNYVRLRK
jgi:hypothetical protein